MKWYGLVKCEYRRWMHISKWCCAREYGYIGSGRIFRSEGVHADIFNLQIILKKSLKLKWTNPLTKLNINKSCYVNNIWLW
jgi:hypothetical protein